MKTNQHLLRLGALALAIAAANAAHAEQTQQNEQLEDLQVWGTEVKASSLKMNEDSFAIKQADHVSDLLRTIPGVDVGGAHSLNQRITIRSMDDKDLKITIDGATQNTYMYHHMGNLQIHADILKSVDVEIGTNSVVNGGLGGAVRFETKTADQLLEPGKDFGARIQANTSSNGSDGWSLIGYGKLADSFDYLLYHNVVNGDDYKVGGGKIKNEFGEEVEDTNGEVRGLDGEVTDTLVKFGWDITAEQRIAISYEAYVDDGDYSYRPDMGLATDLAISEALDAPLLWPTEFTRDTLTLSYDAQLGETYLKATLFDNQSDLERDETGYKTSTAFVRGQPVAEWAATIEGGADNTGLNVLAETDANQHVLTYGLEYIKYETEYRADYLIGTVDSNSEEAITTSLFLQDRIQINDAVAVIPGIRYDEYDIESTLVTETFSDITGALAIEYAVQPSLLLKLSSTELFQAPEIGEAFIGAGLFDYPNAEIEAESGFNHEFSLAFEDAVLGADEFATGFTLFRTEIDNYIHDYAPPPADSGVREWKDNVGDMVIDGFEAYVGYNIGSLSLLLTYSNAESELDAFTAYGDVLGEASLDGARIDREQGDTISFSVDYDMSSIDVKLHYDVLNVDDVAHGPDLAGASVERSKEGFTVHNISASWSPQQVDGLTVIAGVDNLTDEYYASQSSRTGTSAHPLFGSLYLLDYEPGRNFKLTLSYKL